MPRKPAIVFLALILALGAFAQNPAPVPNPPISPTDKKADPKKPEKGEQEPRPVDQEAQKQASQSKDAPAPPVVQSGAAPSPADAKDDAKSSDKKDEKPKWSVSNPPGPKYDVDLDVREGTWISLDVSPDGREIVFDLLGDLYSIPFGGGEAKALTTGIEWDMQPRFSPNGKWIAFTSDRAGGDNVWIMNRDGSDPRQVSKESFRLLNQPVWSPDSEFIVARKHFTSERSL
ncbi:MAG TPA: amidohydrolase, partial [Thermoanaerobaculia bacterium]